jgi:tetratricopeptide (TPR) repeat protein
MGSLGWSDSLGEACALQISNSGLAKQFELALSLHRAGRLAEAIAAYRGALEQAPDDAETASLLGLAMAQAGHGPGALEQLERAVAAEPGKLAFRLNLVLGLLNLGMNERAEAEARAVLERDPGNPRALELLGDISLARSEPAAAAQLWRESFAKRFTLPLAMKLVRFQISQFHFDKADEALDELIPHFGDNPLVHIVHCELLAARRDWPSLERVARFLTQRFPGHREGWKWLATALFEAGLYQESVAAFRRVVESGASGAEEWAAYAGLCIHALAFDEARAALDQAAALDPGHPAALQRRALLHLYCGQLDEAADCSRRCLAGDPANVSAYTTLVRARRGAVTDPELAALKHIAADAGTPLDNRIAAAFAAGHVHDAREDFDAAIAAYGLAHTLAQERDRIEGRAYDAAASEARAAGLPMQLELPQLPAQPPDSPRPIFIVGMPRSGTTLAECVLGAHPDVVACGERMVMQQVLQAWLALRDAGRSPDAATLAAWRDATLRGLPELGGALRFTDKHPLNFEAIGLITRLFPDAAIVWLRRDPVETCLSIYRQEFNKRSGFVHQLADIAHYYGLHERLMARWMERLPGRIIEIRYETFAADIAREAPKLVGAVGLEWDPRCLEFQSSSRPIATFSAVDVRDPVTVRAGRGARYRRHLDELVAALAAAGVAVPPGAIRQDDPIAG